MKLLVVTQKVDKNDPILGFFHRWLEEFAKHCKFMTVICLEMGEYHLPANVKVLSLGKEKTESNVRYIVHFYKHIWQERKNYDAVFVHMNQEYILLGWKIWKLLGKKIYLWRNHAKGNLFTRLVVILSDKVFCTSPSSYTARFKKTKLMPVGIDTEFFRPDPTVARVPHSVLFLGRIAPVKKVLEFVTWLKDLKGFSYATIAGDALSGDEEYKNSVYEKVSEYSLASKVKFIGAVNQEEARKLYRSHETYVNFTPAGSFDKTIFEAAACGAKLIVRNPDFRNDIDINEHSVEKVVGSILNAMLYKTEHQTDFYQIFKYGISGGAGFISNIFSIYLFTDILELWYIWSAILSFFMGFVVSFSLQKWWTFQDPSLYRIRKQSVQYFLIAIAMLILNIFFLTMLVEVFHFWYLSSQVVTVACVSVLSFFLNKNITFNNLKD